MAAAPENLSQFNLAETDDGYVLEIGGDAGSLIQVAVTTEQIDAIIAALDALVSPDDDATDETPA